MQWKDEVRRLCWKVKNRQTESVTHFLLRLATPSLSSLPTHAASETTARSLETVTFRYCYSNFHISLTSQYTTSARQHASVGKRHLFEHIKCLSKAVQVVIAMFRARKGKGRVGEWHIFPEGHTCRIRCTHRIFLSLQLPLFHRPENNRAL